MYICICTLHLLQKIMTHTALLRYIHTSKHHTTLVLFLLYCIISFSSSKYQCCHHWRTVYHPSLKISLVVIMGGHLDLGQEFKIKHGAHIVYNMSEVLETGYLKFCFFLFCLLLIPYGLQSYSVRPCWEDERLVFSISIIYENLNIITIKSINFSLKIKNKLPMFSGGLLIVISLFSSTAWWRTLNFFYSSTSEYAIFANYFKTFASLAHPSISTFESGVFVYNLSLFLWQDTVPFLCVCLLAMGETSEALWDTTFHRPDLSVSLSIITLVPIMQFDGHLGDVVGWW